MNFVLYLIILLISIILFFHTKVAIIETNNLKNDKYCHSKTDWLAICSLFYGYQSTKLPTDNF